MPEPALGTPAKPDPEDEGGVELNPKFPTKKELLAFGVVLAAGAFGGWFIKLVPFKFADDVSKFSCWQSMLIGAVGAFLTVFYVAKTDLRRFWNVVCVALLCGISGPKVIENIVNPKEASASSAAEAKEAERTSSKLEEKAKGSDPNAFGKTVEDTTQKVVSSLQLFELANQANPERKPKELATTEESLKKVLEDLDKATDHSPRKVLPAVAKIATLAKKSGAEGIANQAEEIITKAQNSDNNSVKEAANAPEVSQDSAKLYFITPDILTDSGLSQIKNQVSALFPTFSIQPTVHPKRSMESGIEVVYYNDADASTAQKLLDYVKSYCGSAGGTTRLGRTSDGSRPSQIDIHLGPDVAGDWPGNSAASDSQPQTTTISSPSPAQATASPAERRRRNR